MMGAKQQAAKLVGVNGIRHFYRLIHLFLREGGKFEQDLIMDSLERGQNFGWSGILGRIGGGNASPAEELAKAAGHEVEIDLLSATHAKKG